MLPLEVLNKLNSLKTVKSRQAFLRKLPEDHDFWFGAKHALEIGNACFPIAPWANSYTAHGEGAIPAGIFKRIVDGMDGEHIMKALAALSERSTEEEWDNWYVPILSGNLIIPLSPAEFAEIAPPPYNEFSTNHLKMDFLDINNVEGSFYPHTVEPFYEAPRALWYIGKHSVAFQPDGRRVTHPLFKHGDDLYRKTQTPFLLDLYMESDEILILRDIINTDVFFNGHTPSPHGIVDRTENALVPVCGLLNKIGLQGVDIIEREISNSEKGISFREDAQLILEQGHPGIVFIRSPGTVAGGYPPVVAKPDKKNVFTCLDILEGKGKYEDKAESIIGRGTINHKRIESKIYYGLNWEQRDTYFRDRDQLIGQKFEIRSCGVNENGLLIMPIFHKWRK